ncbi:GW dipeptide domain-containing protein [Bacillus rubiinfantis]|uniref:GW dipeptide domain-containing protein n=1 Tax=Bacillus rubiinfantis TaxID=1499680 RepID=UPI000693C48A|nr:GW dipeptide domain-containing protein [Bacillus rubiinfantis]
MKKFGILVLSVVLVGFGLILPMRAEAATSSKVNDYILSKKLVSAKVENKYISYLPKFPYRHGYGQVEGVVAHETANNNSTITGEISYMSRNYRKAFVHAFADSSRVIEIHSPNYGAWGAGSAANQRFVHIELVRVKKSEKTFSQFAKSINNYANYIAATLYRYNLPLIDAEKTGTGTLWSHKAVTKYLGHTTHQDPHSYFSAWGYSWTQFVQLVKYKYEQLPDKRSNTNRLGQIHSSSALIYRKYDDEKTAFKAGSNNTNRTLFIKKVALIGGQPYYLLSNQASSVNGVIGWIKAADVTSYPNSVVSQKTKTVYLSGKGSTYQVAWGGKKDIINSSLTSYQDRKFTVTKTEKVGNDVWYQGSFNGKTIWINAANTGTKIEKATSRLGKISSSKVTIYKTIGSTTGKIQAGTNYTGKVYYIKRKAAVNGRTYYLLSTQPSSTRGVIGWVNSANLISSSHVSVDHKTKKYYFTGKGSTYSKPYGGTKDVVQSSLSKYKYRQFTINLTEKVGSTLWYRGKLAGKTIWMSSSNLKKTVESATSRVGKVKKSSARLYKKLGANSSFKAGKTYTNKSYYIKRQAKYAGGTYYLLAKNFRGTRTIAWVKATDVSSHAIR